MTSKIEKTRKKRYAETSPRRLIVTEVLRTNDIFQYRFGQLFREYGLTQPQYNVLKILREEGKPLPCLEIADRLITIVPAITSLIDKLEKRALVERRRCDHDRRVWYVELTKDGKELLATMDRPVRELHDQLCSQLTNPQCQQLATLLERARGSCHNEAT